MWGAVEAAWERDVINGDARSRAEFFSYAAVSVVGLKGVDKLGKAGKATSKADTTLPYNALKTDKLKDTVKANVYATVQQKTQQAANFWKSNFSKEAINKTIEAAKNSAVMTKAKNTLNTANIKTAAAKTYEAVVKTPIAKTQEAWEKKKEQLLDMSLPNLGLSPVPLGPTANMTVREGIEAAQNTVMQIVGNKDGGGERTEDTVKDKRVAIVIDIEEISKLLKTAPDTAFFWSGRTNGIGGADRAAEIAKTKGGVTLESTIADKNIKMPEWDFNNPDSIKAWEDASAEYAKQISGEIRAVVGKELREGNIWEILSYQD